MAAAVSPEQFRRICVWAIAALAAIVMTGAAVRLTGSGLGCSDWPTCERGTLVPERGVHSAIELGNRLFSAVPAVAVALAVRGARRRRPYRRDLEWWAWGLVVGVVAQIVVGAIVVRTELLPSAVIVHFGLSMVLLWNALVLHQRARPDAPPIAGDPVPSGVVTVGRAAVAVAVYVLITGTVVTGTGPHSGDTAAADRLPFFLPDVVRFHTVGVIVLCALAVAIAVWAWPRPGSDPLRRRSVALVGVIVVQGAIGYVQYFLDVPALLVAAHIVGAMAVWLTVLELHHSLVVHRRAAPTGATTPPVATAGQR